MKKAYYTLFLLQIVFYWSPCICQVNLNAGLVAYYPFNGNANDASGNGNNASFNNATLTADRFGNTNSAYYFNGVNNYIEIPNSPSLNPAQITLCALVKPMGFYYGACHGNAVLNKGTDSYVPGLYRIRFDDGLYTGYQNCANPMIDSIHQEFYADFGGNGVVNSSYTPYVQKNTWFCVVYTYDGAHANFYVNGVLKFSSASSIPFTPTTDDLFFGTINSALFPYWFNGVLDEVRIYNRAINQQEVAAICNLCNQPQGSLVGDTICSGNPGMLTFNATVGTPPFTVQYSDGTNKYTQTNIISGVPFQVAVNPSSTTTYIIDSIADATACSRTIGFIQDTAQIVVNKCNPQTVVASFTAPSSVCIDSSVKITNTSIGATTYYWNFCTANINQSPIGTNLGNPGGLFNTPVYIDYVLTNGNYYGFVTNNAPGGLLRLDFGNSLLNTPVATSLGTVGGAIPNNTEGIQIANDNGNWYLEIVGGDVTDGSVPSLTTVSLGTNIANNSPTATNWGNIGNLSYPHDLYVFNDNGHWYGLTVNEGNNTITRFDFTNSLANTPTAVNLGNVGNLDGPTGIQAINDNGNWRVFVTNALSSTLTRLDFGSSLLNTPTGVNLGNPNNAFVTSWDIYILRYCGENLGFVINANGSYDIVKLDFGSSLLNTPTAVSLGNQGNLDFPHCLSKLFRVGPDVFSFITNVNNNTLTLLKFPGCTNSSISNSTSQNPPAITYDSAGLYNINLTVDDGLPTQASYCQQILVKDCTLGTALCTGSLGDPVVNITFGSGTNPGQPLPTIVPGASTTMTYVAVTGNPATPTPVDGQYTITNNVPFNADWFSGAGNHTPNDPSGYMAFYNASQLPSEFYSQPVNNLCGSTTYEFAAWIANAVNPALLNGVLPNITFNVEQTDGTILATYNTGDIPENASFTWNQYGFYFTTPASISTIVLKMINNNPGGTATPGNDFAIDDITFRPCGPITTASFSSTSSVDTLKICESSSTNIYGTVSTGYTTPNYLWQISSDSGKTWTDIPSSNNLNLPVTPTVKGLQQSYYYRMITGEGSNVNSTYCRVASNLVVLIVNPLPFGSLSGNNICPGTTGMLTFNSTAGTPPFNIQYTDGTNIYVQNSVISGTPFAVSKNPVTTTAYFIKAITDSTGCTSTSGFTKDTATITVNNCTLSLCKGSLGYPVVNITFGSGAAGTFGPALQTTSTGYGFQSSGCVIDNNYEITNQISNCYVGDWHTISQDHTGNPGGYFMLIGASDQPSDFYLDTVRNLCGSTTYEFAAWVLNMMLPTGCGGTGGLKPNITFSIEDINGNKLGVYNTGDIGTTAFPTWVQYGLFFTTPANTTNIVLRMTNNGPGGCGNDILLDDITFRTCGPITTASFSSAISVDTLKVCEGAVSANIYGTVSTGYNAPNYLWQVSSDSGSTWTDIPNSNSLNLLVTPVATGSLRSYIYRMMTGEGSNVNSTNCRVASNLVILIVFPNPHANLTAGTICNGDSAIVLFKATTGSSPFNIAYSANGNPYAQNGIGNNSTFTIPYLPADTTTITLTSVTDANGCITNADTTTIVNVNPLPQGGIAGSTVCSGDSAGITFTATSGIGPFELEVSDGTNTTTYYDIQSGVPFHIAPVTGATNISLISIIDQDGAGCTRTNSFTSPNASISVIPSPVIQFDSLTPICIQQSAFVITQAKEITGIAGNGSFSGQGVNVSGNFSPTSAGIGTHTITYSFLANNGCSSADSATITVNPTPTISAGPDVTTCIGFPVQLKATGGATYLWSPVTGLDNPGIQNPVASIDSTTTYIVLGTDSNGCYATDTLTINVGKNGVAAFVVPNAFTPNGDGRNDCFGISKWGEVTVVEFTIFNRWGQLVFTTKNPSDCWDGTYQGKKQDAGGYPYIIKVKSPCGDITRTGIVVLIR